VENGTLATATTSNCKTLDIKLIEGERRTFVNGVSLDRAELIGWLDQFSKQELMRIISSLGES